MKKIGILTSGGDAPGMNAAIRAVTRASLDMGFEVIGFRRGYAGLLEDDKIIMTSRGVSGIIQRGGTILHSARCKEFTTEEGRAQGAEILRKNNIVGLVTIGGDGTFRGAKVLSEKYDIPTIGVPATIDNDLAYTDFTIGFNTACNSAANLINNIRDTMNSHERVGIVEIMGRNCGDIALYSGLASGSEIIMVPEVKVSMDEVANRVMEIRKRKSSVIIVLAEGAGKGEDVAREIEKRTGNITRATVLGHIIRGGSPTMNDRLIGTQFGYRAALLLKQGIGNRAVGIRDQKIIDVDIFEASTMENIFRRDLYEASKVLSF